MKDRLQELFDRQLQQQSNWMDITALTDEERDRLLRDLSLYMIHEIMEFMDARKYKRHKIWEEPLPRDTRIFELIDIQKYLLTAALAEGISADEWYDYFIEKTKIVDVMIHHTFVIDCSGSMSGELSEIRKDLKNSLLNDIIFQLEFICGRIVFSLSRHLISTSSSHFQSQIEEEYLLKLILDKNYN